MEKNVPADRFAFGIGAFSRRWKAMFDAYERIVQNTTLDDDDDFCEKKSENESILLDRDACNGRSRWFLLTL